MLPDFPNEKALIAKFWNEYLVQKHREFLGFFASFPSFLIHEGNRWGIERSDGSDFEQEYEEMSSTFAIEYKDVPYLTSEKIMAKLNLVAEEGARQMKQKIMTELQKASDESGNSYEAKGQPLTKKLYLKLFEKIGGFDDNEKWHNPVLLMSPQAMEANKGKLEKWGQDKEFLEQQEKIKNKKWEEHNAREALRKLVD